MAAQGEIEHLLNKALEFNETTDEFDAWSNEVIGSFIVKPRERLSSFLQERVRHNTSDVPVFCLTPRMSLAGELMALSKHSWNGVGGAENPDRGLLCAALASVEYVRAQLQLVLWFGARLDIYRKHRPEAAQRFVDEVLSIDWHSSEAVLCRGFRPLSIIGASESSADDLYNWLGGVSRPVLDAAELHSVFPGAALDQPTVSELMCGAALHALDLAIAMADPMRAMGLLALAANAMWQAGFQSGWDGLEETRRDDAKHAGKRGGTLRHQASRELKSWAVAEARSLRGSDIENARQLARNLPERFHNVSADPERLIYEALRSLRSVSRQGG